MVAEWCVEKIVINFHLQFQSVVNPSSDAGTHKRRQTSSDE